MASWSITSRGEAGRPSFEGFARFRVTEEQGGEPYRRAAVEDAAEEPGHPEELESARQRLLQSTRDSDPVLLVSAASSLPHDKLEASRASHCRRRWDRIKQTMD